MTNDPKDVREMRQLINRASRGARVDGKERNFYAPSASMIRNVLVTAEYHGLSGEDAMTMLAYQALKAYEEMYDRVLEFHLTTMPVILVPKEQA